MKQRPRLAIERLEGRDLLTTISLSYVTRGNDPVDYPTAWQTGHFHSMQPQQLGEVSVDFDTLAGTTVVLRTSHSQFATNTIPQPSAVDEFGHRLPEWQTIVGGSEVVVFGDAPDQGGRVTVTFSEVTEPTEWIGVSVQFVEFVDAAAVSPIVVPPIDPRGFDSTYYFARLASPGLSRIDPVSEWRMHGDATSSNSIDNKGTLTLATEPYEPGAFGSGVVLDYDSTTGDLTLEGEPMGQGVMATIELSEGEFVQLPEVLRHSVDAYRPTSLSLFHFTGETVIHFENLLPPALSADDLRRLVTIDVSGSPRIAYIPVHLSIDGEPTSVGELSAPFRVRVDASRDYASITEDVFVEFEYHWTPGAPADTAMASVDSYERPLEPCDGNEWCRVVMTVPNPERGAAWSPSVSFQNESIGGTLQVRDLAVAAFPTEGRRIENDYRVTVPSGTSIFSYAVADSGYPVEIHVYDDAGELVSIGNSIVLSTPESQPDQVYRVKVIGHTRPNASYQFEVHRAFDPYDSSVPRPTGSYDEGEITSAISIISSLPNLDLRTCSVDDFTWDGPPFARLEAVSEGIRLDFDGTLPHGDYEIDIRDGRCLTTTGHRGRAVYPILVDNSPLRLVDVPLLDTRTIYQGDDALTITFDDQVSHARLPIQILSGGELIRDVEFEFFSGASIVLNMGPLAPGDYELAGSFTTWSGGQLTVPLDTSFTVVASPPPPEMRFDVDRNGLLNGDDVNLLTGVRYWQNVPRFDIDGNGVLDANDVDVLLRDGFNSRPGDVDFDGDFDHDDLALLSSTNFMTRASWTEGDFNGDGTFDHDDLLYAFTRGWDGA